VSASRIVMQVAALALLAVASPRQTHASAGPPPKMDDLLNEERPLEWGFGGDDPDLLQSRFFTQLITLTAACAAAERIARAPLNASQTSVTLSSLSRYEALCGTNTPLEVSAFKSNAIALQAFALSLQSLSLKDRVEAQEQTKVSASFEISGEAEASPISAQASAQGDLGADYASSSEFKAVAEREIIQQKLSKQEASDFQRLFMNLLSSQTSLETVLAERNALLSKAASGLEPSSVNQKQALQHLDKLLDESAQN
jgi:hypothetical protein